MVARAELPSPDNPQAALAAVVALRRLANQLERAAVDHALRDGWTWAQIGQALGVSAQAAHKKLAHKKDHS
ncbi:helix-turn-helix domain-containing protein [Micromonospora sp. NPDC047812]|uniref:helix-turn-helix domain-containing protein n=1 Tax=Micromonospora sp. NPDC047812 TaxID=3155742 RepID=UPI0034516A9F